jgi:aspartyl aminopeptidase
MMRMPVVALAVSLTAFAPGLRAQEASRPSSDHEAPPSHWLALTPDEREDVERFASEYKAFMSEAKTELSFVAEALELAREAGFAELTEDSKLTPGARFYDVNRDRALALIVVGDERMQDGFQVLGAHIDSPRLELKPRALYESEGFALFQTNYHGWIKTYQWTNIPLALMGRVDKKDGTTIRISVGNRPGEPVFIIADLSPHVDEQLRERTAMEVIDFGIPILSIHTPYSVSSKLDVYNLYRAMKAFCLR